MNHVAISRDKTIIAAFNSDGHCVLFRFNHLTGKYAKWRSVFEGGSYGGSISCNNALLCGFGSYTAKITVYNLDTDNPNYGSLPRKYKLLFTKASSLYHLPRFSPTISNLLLYPNENNMGIVLFSADGSSVIGSHRIKMNTPFNGCFSENGRYFCMRTANTIGILELKEKWWLTSSATKCKMRDFAKRGLLTDCTIEH